MNPRYTVAFDRTVGRPLYRVHAGIYRLTGGLIGHRSPLGPMLLLTTIGRRTGQQRTTPLLYMADGDIFLVVGSNGGRERPPTWLLNLNASPAATVQVGRRRTAATAEVLRGEDRAAIWPRLVDHYAGWNHYQQLTNREIPVVRLTPVP